tara:strand:- start:2392 stop:3867 length:1476 start_codon:yes stop_codon:yes gene_type:complete
MKIVELILEDGENVGVDAISIVENPAIEEDFVALKSQEVKFAEADKEKKILVGALLTPNKPIYRRSGEEEYYIYFSRETVRKASQLFLKDGNQSNSTLEHQQEIEGLTLVESWIVEDKQKDKSAMYNMDVPLGTWMGAVKVDNDEIWENYVKTGKVKGFSIEGYFADKVDRPKDQGLKEELARIEEEEAAEFLASARAIIKNDKRHKSGKTIEMESYSDYPASVKNNAKRGLELNKKQGNKCATQVGKVRAQQLAQGKPVSEATIKRMFSYLSRAETYYDQGDPTTCGYISYLLWGGKTAKNWAERKIKSFEGIAEEVDLKAPCWDGYEMKGWKIKGGKKVPNCVKMSELAEIGPRGGIKKSPKAPGSSTPNKNPKGEGTAKGDASTGRGAKVSKKDEESLQKKSDDFNKRYKDKLGYGVTVGKLKAVFQRGLGAFNVSHSPKVSSASQWAHARVNAFMYLVRNGRPENAKYTGDFDLLPAKHPKSPQNKK